MHQSRGTRSLGIAPSILRGINATDLRAEELEHGDLHPSAFNYEDGLGYYGKGVEDARPPESPRLLCSSLPERIRLSGRRVPEPVHSDDEELPEMPSEFIYLTGGGSNFGKRPDPPDVVDDHEPDDWEGVLAAAVEAGAAR